MLSPQAPKILLMVVQAAATVAAFVAGLGPGPAVAVAVAVAVVVAAAAVPVAFPG